MANKASGPMVAQTDIERGLRELGLSGGETVLVHSSLRSFGYVDGGAETVVQAVLNVIGEEGCVVMPTLTLGASENPVIFNVRQSPSRTGRVTETFRKRPEAWRSHHPTSSAAAIGRTAEEMTRHHHDTPCGPESPYGQVYHRDGYSLFLGAPWSSNTIFHVAEEILMPHYLRFAEFHDATVVDEQGRIHRVNFRRYNCCQTGVRRDLAVLGPVFEEAGVVRHTKIGFSDCRLIRAQDNVELSIRFLKEHPERIWTYER